MALIAWYPLNGDTKDYSGNNLHLTNNEATVDVNGKIGSCYLTNQSNKQYLNVTSSIITDALSNGNDFTVCFWQKVDSCQYAVMNISCGNTSATDRMLHIGMRSANVVSMGFYGDDLNGTFSFSPDKWYHITAVYEKGYQKIYVNGKLINSRKSTNYLIVNGKFNIGSYSNTTTTAFYNDVRIYNEALSAKQIKEIAQAKICHYTFNEELYENTTNLYDNKNKLSIVNAVVEWENTHALKCEIAANTKYTGLNFNSNLTLEPLTTYTLSYKFKKVAGKLLQIRGHVEPTSFEVIHTTINGKKYNNSSYSTGIDITDSFDTYEIIIVFNTKENITSMDKMYIQPNAIKDEYVKVRIWDIQVEKKDHATPFTTSSRSQVLKDISGYGYDMTTYNQYSPVWNKDDSSNKIKNYSTLTKKDSYSNLNFKYKYPDAFTFSCWVRTTDNEAFCLVGFPSGNNTFVSLAINNHGRISLHSCLSTPDINGDKWYAGSTTAINDGEWHFVAATYDGTTAKSYIDGKYEASSTVTFDFKRQTISDLAINMLSPDSNWGDYETRRYEGDISDVRVYATALSAEDIKLLYQPEISIDKTNVIRCSEINEERIQNKKGFSKDASITYNEFNEIPNIESGIHNLKLGNQILPVLIDMDNDGGRWARVFYHNCKSGTVLFSSENSFAEAKETNTNAPTTSDKYSILSKLESFRPNTNSSFEFKLKYPTDTNGSNIWKQTSNPTHQKVTGYKPIKIDWTHEYWGGLEYCGHSSALIDGSVNIIYWFYAIGVSTKHWDGIPSCTNVNNNGNTANDVELWVRINNYDLFADNLIENVSISRNGVLTAKEFREIY